MARLTKQQLQAVKDKYGVSELWSWSKLDSAIISPYLYFLKYILHVKEDRDDSAYAPLGSICHSALEAFYNGEIQYEDMIGNFEEGWLTAIDIADLKFDRNDASKNSKIAIKYKENLQHFFQNHTRLLYKPVLEKFVAAKIGDHVFQGYIDVTFKDDQDYYHIIDWKTSTIYTGKTAQEKCGQLVIYAIALNQMGVPLDKIRCAWNFLKYVTIEYKQKNGAVKSRNVERCKIGESLQANAKMWLKSHGYSESETDRYLQILLDTNNIASLPEEVQQLYKISDCYVYIDLDAKLMQHWCDYIIQAISDIKLREKEYEAKKSDMAFWDTDESIKSQEYFLATLCGYSPSLHRPYKLYLEKQQENKNGNMFAGIGSESDSSFGKATKRINNSGRDIQLDLSWLDNI